MALTAKFIADFSSFNDAVNKAEVQLKSFETGASKVEKALTRMTDSFSGRKIVSEATLTAKAIENIGGVSKLTANELQRVGAQAQEAIAKMKAIGVEVPAGVQKIADAAKNAEGWFSRMGSALKTATGFLGGLGISVGIGALVSAGRAALNYADSLVKLSDKTGISTTSLQKLQAVAQASGNSLEDISSAVNKFQKNITTGNSEALQAISKLGLSIDTLKKLSPDEQFFQIAKAIQSIKDPAEQTTLAMQLFGRSGAELLPTLKADVDKLKDSTFQMSESSVKALDDFGDRMSAFGTSAINVLGEVAGAAVLAASKIIELSGSLPKDKGAAPGTELPTSGRNSLDDAKKQAAEFTGQITFMGKVVRESTIGIVQGFQAGSDAVDGLHQSFEDFREKELEKTNAALKAFNQTLRDVLLTSKGYTVVLDTLDGQVLEGVKFYRDRGVTLERLAEIYGLTKVQVEALGEAEKLEAQAADINRKIHVGLGKELEKTGAIAVELGARALPQFNVGLQGAAASAANLAHQSVALGQVLGNVFKGLPDTLIRAFEGGGGLIGAFKSFAIQIGDAFADALTTAMKQAVKAGQSLVNSTTLKAAAGLGAAAGVGALAAGSSTKGAFGAVGTTSAGVVASAALAHGATIAGVAALGVATLGVGAAAVGAYIAIRKLLNNPEKKVNPIRQQFIDAAGGLDELNKRAHDAGVTLKALLDAKDPQAYKKAIDDLNAALQFQDDAMATLDETVKRYGFSIEELGPALQKQNLDKQAQGLYQDFKVLTSAGISTDVVLGRMGDSINDFVHAALKTGTEIPAAMAPMLQRMVEMGMLTDENGNVITDLEQSGVHFAETMTQGFQKIVDAVQKLTDAITRGLGLAIENIPDPEVEGHVSWKVDDFPDSARDFPTTSIDVPALASGGIVSRPTLALIGEAGPEAVVPLDRLNSTRGGVTVTIGSLNVHAAPGDDPKALGDKMIEALRAYTPVYDAIGNIAQRRAAA